MEKELDKLIIYRKTFNLYLYAHPLVAKFPQNERFTLGQKIENSIALILELIIRANTVRGDRIEFFKRISLEIDLLFTWVKLAVELHFISIKQYGVLIEKINEIAKISIGWLKDKNM